MWTGLGNRAWEAAAVLQEKKSALARSASDLRASANEKWEHAASAEPQQMLGTLWEGAATAAASAADSAGVLARRSKLKGEIALLQNNITAWKREWGEESFDLYYSGDLTAVSVSLYRVKAEMDTMRRELKTEMAAMREEFKAMLQHLPPTTRYEIKASALSL